MHKCALKWYNFEHDFDEIFVYGVNEGWFYQVDRDIWKIWWDYFKDVCCWEEAKQYIHPDNSKPYYIPAIGRRRDLHIARYYNARKEFKLLRGCEKRLTQAENKKL